jgi:hypothetical protein
MNETITKKSKWFWPWQDDREEAWLGQMAKQGLHLVHVGTYGRYIFASGEPRDMVYRLDFVPSNRMDDAYFQLFRDAGWDNISVDKNIGWQYWRKEVKAGETPEIFTDVESKVQKYQRLLGFLAIVFLPVAIGLFNMRILFASHTVSGSWIEWFFFGITMLMFTMFILYIYIFIRIGMRIRQLKRL